MPTVTGPFEVKLEQEPPFDEHEGVSLGRTIVRKTFTGPLTATSTVWMQGVSTPVKGSAAYVAVERIVGTLEGRHGSFVALHIATMTRGTPSLQVIIAPDSGTGELSGISGTIRINFVGGHSYELSYELGSGA